MSDLSICAQCGRPVLPDRQCIPCDLERRAVAAQEGLALALLDVEVSHDLTIPSEPPADLSFAAETILKVVDLVAEGVIKKNTLAFIAVDENAPLTTEERIALINPSKEDQAAVAAAIVARNTRG